MCGDLPIAPYPKEASTIPMPSFFSGKNGNIPRTRSLLGYLAFDKRFEICTVRELNFAFVSTL